MEAKRRKRHRMCSRCLGAISAALSAIMPDLPSSHCYCMLYLHPHNVSCSWDVSGAAFAHAYHEDYWLLLHKHSWEVC